jgi:RNA polymerase sigma-70 factor (ECF subfamily)
MTETIINTNNFKDLYNRHFGVLVNFAYSKTKDLELSREIVQNTFVKLWNSRADIEIRSSVESYLFSMVRNGIIDHFRKNEKIVEMKDFSGLNTIENDAHKNSEEEIIELRYNLKKAINSLKEKRRVIFNLNKAEGLTYQEIAEYLKISERVVEDNISKAMKEIRQYFIENKLL